MNRQKLQYFNLLELCILLALPLPFLHLNIFYVITAIIIILISRYLRKEKWSDYGFRSVNKKEILLAVIIGIGYGFIDNYLTEPLINRLTGSEPDLSSYEWVKGSLSVLFGMLALGWIVGGFFEESFFRGYLFYRLNSVVSDQRLFKFLAVTLISVVFAFAHEYQGISGIIGTFLFSLVLSLLYFFFRGNVWYLILIHGFYDTVGIFKLYLGN